MNLSGIVVFVSPREADAAVASLQALPGVQVHGRDDHGRLIVVQESPDVDGEVAGLRRIQDLEAQLGEFEKEFADLEEVWKAEKAAMQGTTHIKEELERARLELETAHRANDLTRMSELQYGRIPELEKQLAEATKAENRETTLLRNNVTEEEVAEIVSKWTGIPVSKMLEGEKEKLLQIVLIGQPQLRSLLARPAMGVGNARRTSGCSQKSGSVAMSITTCSIPRPRETPFRISGWPAPPMQTA